LVIGIMKHTKLGFFLEWLALRYDRIVSDGAKCAAKYFIL
jgi:hypothetical protein